MLPILIFLFILVPAMEIYLLLEVGSSIGGFNTFLLVMGTGILGASLAKSQGLNILMKIQSDVNRGELPGDQIIQGLMVFAGGLLLLTPGFVTDIFGFSLILPGPRYFLMIFIKKGLNAGIKNGNIKFGNIGGMSAGGFSYQTHSESTANPFEQSEHTSKQQVDGDIIEAEFVRKD